MTDVVRLKDAIKRSGYTHSYLEKQSGMGKCSFSLKINGHRPFNQDEISALKRVLKLTKTEVDEIFFANEVDKVLTKE